MARYVGKYLMQTPPAKRRCPYILVTVFFFLVELFACRYLTEAQVSGKLWPLAFGGRWAVTLSGILRLLPWQAGRIGFAVAALGMLVYSVGQTGYYLLFSEMMWLSDFRYASEGADYLDVVLSFPAGWFLWVLTLLVAAVLLVWKYPRYRLRIRTGVAAVVLSVIAVAGAAWLPQKVFQGDGDIRYSGSDYGRAQSAEAAYENMFNAHRLYRVCGLHQMLAKDIYTNALYPLMPGYAREQERLRTEIDAYFAERALSSADNEMTGILKGKNVVLVLMESVDDWMLGDHTPTIIRLMAEGINFTSFYTPPYGGIRTFNTEFCINTGTFLSSQKGYAFDYVTNSFDHSLPNLLKGEGYSAKLFHYNDPTFYSRDVFSEALGYEEYVCYGDYVEETDPKKRKQILYDDLLLLSDPGLRSEFFRDVDKTFNFVITRSAHLSYKYNEVLSHWALKKYPEYKGMTGSEETDCALVKARLVDDLFQWLLMALEDEGQLENTVIIGITDHYTYGYKNTQELLKLSGVEDTLLLEKTPCFIWSTDLEPMVVDKTLNTADLLPTLLNLLGIESEYKYLGRDAFDPAYDGFVPFSNGGWIAEEAAYDSGSGRLIAMRGNTGNISPEENTKMGEKVRRFIQINNSILQSDYYQ